MPIFIYKSESTRVRSHIEKKGTI